MEGHSTKQLACHLEICGSYQSPGKMKELFLSGES
jgi:hypothetical protein